jgi:hypothetical protein
MMEADMIVFWDATGEEIVSITGNGITSDQLLALFDCPTHRKQIYEASGRMVDNVSEEVAEEMGMRY